jgi:hypothetical protein
MRALQVADAMVLWRPADRTEVHLLEKYVLPHDGKIITPFSLQPIPYLDEPGFTPWPSQLSNKVVLVISPFIDSIKQQHAKIHEVWPNNTYTAASATLKFARMEQAGAKHSPGCDFIHTFQVMTRKIRSQGHFDVAVISAGAFGLPLAGYIKDDLNRSAIVTGGAGQLLWGLKGNRWTTQKPGMYDRDVKKYFNQHWQFPLATETPANSASLEKSAYFDPNVKRLEEVPQSNPCTGRSK